MCSSTPHKSKKQWPYLSRNLLKYSELFISFLKTTTIMWQWTALTLAICHHIVSICVISPVFFLQGSCAGGQGNLTKCDMQMLTLFSSLCCSGSLTALYNEVILNHQHLHFSQAITSPLKQKDQYSADYSSDLLSMITSGSRGKEWMPTAAKNSNISTCNGVKICPSSYSCTYTHV